MSIWRVYDALGNILEQGSNAAANAHDGNTTTYYTLYPPELVDAPYIIEEDFGQPVTVTQFKVYPTNVDAFNWVRVEYWTGSTWALVGTATTNNAWNTFSGSWTTSKWRVKWDGDFEVGYSVRVNEMQAVVGATTIDVSDSGSGSETATVSIIITASDSGTGTETASTLFTVVVSDNGAGTDQLTDRTLLGLTDTGSGTELATLSETLIMVTDSGAGTETVAAIPHFFVTDSGWGNETPTQLFTFHMTDTGEGFEDLLMDLEVDDASSLTGEEIALVLGQIDEGSGADELPLRLVGVLDNGTGQETSTLIVIAKDNGVGRELAVVTNLLSASDEGSGLEKPLRVIHIGAFVFLRPD